MTAALVILTTVLLCSIYLNALAYFTIQRGKKLLQFAAEVEDKYESLQRDYATKSEQLNRRDREVLRLKDIIDSEVAANRSKSDQLEKLRRDNESLAAAAAVSEARDAKVRELAITNHDLGVVNRQLTERVERVERDLRYSKTTETELRIFYAKIKQSCESLELVLQDSQD